MGPPSVDTLVAEFRRTLKSPGAQFVRGSEARRKFNMTQEDMVDLPYFEKESPYEAHSMPFRQYALPEVVELALRKHGEQALVDHFAKTLHASLREPDALCAPSQYGTFVHNVEEAEAAGLPSKRYWYNAPSTSTVEGRQSVLQGLRTNVGICSIKGGVWMITGSHVMFADLMHSCADVANYAYRLMELHRSSRIRDVNHPYGYAPLRYITADRSFVFLFFVGGVFPVITGLRELAAGAHVPAMAVASGAPGLMIAAPAAVFLASALLEGAAVRAAHSEILSQAKKEHVDAIRGWPFARLGEVFGYLKHGRDVMSTATFTEASSGVLGAGIGLSGLAATWYFESATADVACSVLMGAVVCAVSSFLLRRSGNALLGQTLPSWRVKALVSTLESHPAVCGVYDVKTEMVGTDTVRFKAEVQFHPQSVTERILSVSAAAEAAQWPGAALNPATRLSPGSAADAAAEIGARPTMTSSGSSGQPEDAYHVIAARLRSRLQGLDALASSAANAGNDRRIVLLREPAFAPWLCGNNQLFYEALVWELKDVERELRAELRDFRNVHIDLEPW